MVAFFSVVGGKPKYDDFFINFGEYSQIRGSKGENKNKTESVQIRDEPAHPRKSFLIFLL